MENNENVIIASNGKMFRRKNDGFIMGRKIYLGMDYSTGIAQEDSVENYEEIDITEDYKEIIEQEIKDEEEAKAKASSVTEKTVSKLWQKFIDKRKNKN